MPRLSEQHVFTLLVLLGLVAVVGLIAGIVLGLGCYSSAGAFAVSSACVGVLGTLVATGRQNGA